MEVGVDDMENTPGESLLDEVVDMAYNGVGGGKSVIKEG
jgi:hypothetical protein